MQDELTHKIISAAITVHGALGPGLLESVYEEVLCYALRQMGMHIKRQHPIPVYYKNLRMDVAFRAELSETYRT